MAVGDAEPDDEDLQYTEVAEGQLDALEAGPDADLYNRVCDACELVLLYPLQAQVRSQAVRTDDGIRMRLPVVGSDLKVFWSTDGPTMHAIFDYPT